MSDLIIRSSCVNFHKSKIITLNLEDSETSRVTGIFNCPVVHFPLKYLGVPLHLEKLKREDLQPVVDKML